VHVLLVSKPLAPPWNDSGKNWARDIATYARHQTIHHVMVPLGSDAFDALDNVVPEPVYRDNAAFAPALMDKSRTLVRLLQKRCDLVHFCFAPNRRTNQVAQAIMRLRRQPSVHTVLSVPESFDNVQRLLFAQRVVCVSASTANRLELAGVRGVELVPASIPVPPPLRETDEARITAVARQLGLSLSRPIVLFPGDYEFSRAADVFAGAIERLWQHTDAQFVFACRIKRKDSLERELALRTQLAGPTRAGAVRFLRTVDDMIALLALAAVVAFPAESSYAKMDLPLVLLEALAQKTPLVLADVAPQNETLGSRPEAHGGLLVPPLDPDALAEAIHALLRDEPLRHELGRRGRNHVLQHHDASQVCTLYEEVYRRV